MKKLMISGAAALLILSGCTNKEQEQMIVSLSQEKDSLMMISQEKDQSIDEFIDAFEEIEGNLVEISSRQSDIARQTEENPEMSISVKDRINQEIALIGALMHDSKEKIEELDKKLRASNSRVSKFRKMVATLNKQVAVKDSEMVVLNQQVLALNTQVEELNHTVTDLQIRDSVNTRFIENQTDEMNKAYVAVGPYRSLREKEVIEGKGGILGIGKEQKLNQHVKSDAFTQVDIRQLQSIPLESSDAKLVTVHPTGSYKLKSGSENAGELEITDPDKFWSTSKYLVVMTGK